MVHSIKLVSLFSAVVLSFGVLFCLPSSASAAYDTSLPLPSTYEVGDDFFMVYSNSGQWTYFEFETQPSTFQYKFNGSDGIIPDVAQYELDYTQTCIYQDVEGVQQWVVSSGYSQISAMIPASGGAFDGNWAGSVSAIYNDPSNATITISRYTDLSTINNGDVLSPALLDNQESTGIVYNDPVISAVQFNGVKNALIEDTTLIVPIAFGVLALLFGLRLAIKYFKGIAK